MLPRGFLGPVGDDVEGGGGGDRGGWGGWGGVGRRGGRGREEEEGGWGGVGGRLLTTVPTPHSELAGASPPSPLRPCSPCTRASEVFGDLLNAVAVFVEDEEFDSGLDTSGELLVVFYLGSITRSCFGLGVHRFECRVNGDKLVVFTGSGNPSGRGERSAK